MVYKFMILFLYNIYIGESKHHVCFPEKAPNHDTMTFRGAGHQENEELLKITL